MCKEKLTLEELKKLSTKDLVEYSIKSEWSPDIPFDRMTPEDKFCFGKYYQSLSLNSFWQIYYSVTWNQIVREGKADGDILPLNLAPGKIVSDDDRPYYEKINELVDEVNKLRRTR